MVTTGADVDIQPHARQDLRPVVVTCQITAEHHSPVHTAGHPNQTLLRPLFTPEGAVKGQCYVSAAVSKGNAMLSQQHDPGT